MDMPKPGPELSRLDSMLGEWEGVETMHPSPWVPTKRDVHARVRNAPALDGFAIIQDYDQHMGDQVFFRGHGVLRWDRLSKEYVLHWFDSMGQTPNEFRGTLDGSTLTMTSTAATGSTRAEWKLDRPNHYSYRMEMSPDGKQWQLMMEGKYERVRG